MDETLSRWLGRRRFSSQARLRLFCIPFAGGGASAFNSWIGHLRPGIEVIPIQLPGREERLREPPYTDLSLLTQDLAEALIPYLDVPFAFFGHSFGAYVSFELARQLRKAKVDHLVYLFASGSSAPHSRLSTTKIHLATDEELIAFLRQFNGTSDEILLHSELRQIIVPLIRADFAAFETYTFTPAEPLECPISVFGGKEDSTLTIQQLMQWSQHTSHEFTLRILPGDHFFIRSSKATLLRAIANDLEAFLGRD